MTDTDHKDQRLVVGDAARPHLTDMVRAQRERGSAVRVAVMGGTAGGPGIGLIVDDPGEQDLVFTIGEIDLVIDPSLLSYCGKITIDFQEGAAQACQGAPRGFVITADVPLTI
ncbi:MAG: hypothetical protein N839_0017255 [Desulfofustis sp. PB-SRB1]|jgi:Fe-S cluster assembly iron-binding protein IscA|nr:hypothetical protein [Desulfofustis sp. PB-SRB1]